MEKLLCPYCDHEIKKIGRCETCGSKVRKPVKVQTSAVYDSKPSAQPGECGCDMHSPKQGRDTSGTNQQNWQSRQNQQTQQNRQSGQNQQIQQNQQSRQNWQNKQKPVKNSYSPFIEHIKSLPLATKIGLIYVLVVLVIAFINVILMSY